MDEVELDDELVVGMVVVVLVEVALLVVEDDVTVVVVTAGGQVPGAHVPGPTSTPPCAPHSAGDTTTHWSNAPIGEEATQHCVAAHSQHEVRELTVPPLAVHFSALGEMLQRVPTTQSLLLVQLVLPSSRQVPALRSHLPNTGRSQTTVSSFLPHVERAAHRTTAPWHSSGTSVRAASDTHLTYSPCLVAAPHGHCASIAACAAQLSLEQSTCAVTTGVRSNSVSTTAAVTNAIPQTI